jgi:hypothetical protein
MEKRSAWSLRNSFNPTTANKLANGVCFVGDTFKENAILKGNCVNLGNNDLKTNANGNIRYKPVSPPLWGEMNGGNKSCSISVGFFGADSRLIFAKRGTRSMKKPAKRNAV